MVGGGGAAAAKASLRGRGSVRIVVAGDKGTGKSSLIVTAEDDTFPLNVPPLLPPTRLPDDLYPDRLPVTIIDTSSSVENRGKLAEELKQADAVVLTYACDQPATLDRLSTFWLPELRRLEVKVPVIVVGCKLDLRDEQHPLSLEQVMSPIIQQFREIEACIECSAYKQIQVPEVFYYAQKAVLHPTTPLFDQEAQTLKPRCVRALKWIFISCDHDRDGALSDVELNDFQVKCFNAPLQSSKIVGVERVVQEKLHEGVNDRGLTLTGFLFLHTLFIEKHRLETKWTVLRKFGYNSDIRLSNDQLPPPIKRAPDQEAGDDYSRDVDLKEEIKDILYDDDEERLLALLTSPRALCNDGTPRFMVGDFLDTLCERDAVKCATALLEGKLGGIRVDLDGDRLLHRAAVYCSSKLVQLFLRHAARSDTRCPYWFYDEDENPDDGLLPLDIAIRFARCACPHLKSYPFGGQSTLTLILSLCNLATGKIAVTIKSLAYSSKDIAKQAYHYASKGKLIDLVLLLIVAHKRILVPINLHVEGVSSITATILHWLLRQIEQLTYEEELMGDCEKGKLTEIHRKKMVMRSAALLLEVFERAGHAIDEQMQYLSRSYTVAPQTKWDHGVLRLKEAGFKFKNGDFDFSTLDWFDCDSIAHTYSARTRTSTKYAPSVKMISSPRLPLPRQTIPSLPLRGVHPWSSSMEKSHYINHIPKSISPHYSTSYDVQAKKQTETIEQNVPQCLCKAKLARFARLLRRGTRIA